MWPYFILVMEAIIFAPIKVTWVTTEISAVLDAKFNGNSAVDSLSIVVFNVLATIYVILGKNLNFFKHNDVSDVFFISWPVHACLVLFLQIQMCAT